mgnify:CR=1 FL=1
MKSRLWVNGAIAGLAATAASGSVTLYFTADATDYTIGDTLTWTVSAAFSGYDDPTAYFGGFVGDFLANDPGFGSAHSFENFMSFEGTHPAPNGASLNGINIFNAALLGTDDQSNPIQIARFSVTMDAVGSLSYDASGVVTMFADDGVLTIGETITDFEVVSSRVVWIPSPGAIAVLACGGAWGARRRRR